MREYQGEKKNKICYVLTIAQTVRAFFIPQLRYLAENGFAVTVVCSPDETLQAELGDDVRYVPITIPRGLSPLGMLHGIGSLYTFFKREKFDLIQYSTPNAAFCAAIASGLTGCKLRNYHLMGFRYLGASGIGQVVLKQIEKLTCRLSTAIECVSRSNLEFGVKEKVFTHDKATVVWNGSTGGVDLKKFDFSQREKWRNEVRNALGYADGDFVFGFVGRITRDKGINEILTAYQGVRNKAKLLFVGNAEGLDTIDPQLLAEAQKDKNIIFHHNVPDVERYFAAMDLLLLPSYREGFGNVIIEAAAVGTPAIISNIPGPVDAVEADKTAIIVPVKDFEALSCAMKDAVDSTNIHMEKCADFAKSHFDSNELCRWILKRKWDLIKEQSDYA